ncbi:hypothetical protein J6590_077029 [Homalodisca vitripennis]|nr:hypothetical protein J6590_077029 [Homalodisca vitripennis]
MLITKIKIKLFVFSKEIAMNISYSYKKPGSKCCFTKCKANKRDNPERVFFSFPINDRDICKQWVSNCANDQLLGLSDRQLSYRSVCDHHFKHECFTSDMRTRLEKNAVPTKLNIIEPEVPPCPDKQSQVIT